MSMSVTSKINYAQLLYVNLTPFDLYNTTEHESQVNQLEIESPSVAPTQVREWARYYDEVIMSGGCKVWCVYFVLRHKSRQAGRGWANANRKRKKRDETSWKDRVSTVMSLIPTSKTISLQNNPTPWTTRGSSSTTNTALNQARYPNSLLPPLPSHSSTCSRVHYTYVHTIHALVNAPCYRSKGIL